MALSEPPRKSDLLANKQLTAILLSRREIEVFQWISDGKSDWEISQILGISAKTVNYHVENVKRKYGVATRVQAIVAVVRGGAIDT